MEPGLRKAAIVLSMIDAEDAIAVCRRVDPVTAILRVPPSGGASPPLLPTWSQPTDPQPTAPPDCHWAHCSSSDLCSS